MSDDEEVLFKGTESLYSYLIEQGHSDFETFKPSSCENERLELNCDPEVTNKITDTGTYKKWHGIKTPVAVSSKDHQKLLSILNSQLLFKDDFELLDAIDSNAYISKTSPNLCLYACATVAGLFSSVVSIKKGYNICYSLGITVIFTLFSTWELHKAYMESCENKILVSHISMLQELCSNVHKLLRYLKETEILSTGQAAIHNAGAAMYIPMHVSEMKMDALPLWKTLPHLRKSLFNTLVETVEVLSASFDNVKQVSPSWLIESSGNSLKNNLKSNNELVNSDKCLSIKDLQLLSNVYLELQSEYLRWVAFVFCPVIWENQVKLQNKARKEVFKHLLEMKPKLAYLSFKLMMQYNIHSAPVTSCKTNNKNTLKTNLKGLNSIQAEVHNIFLLMLSLLLRVRSLEDFLEDFCIRPDLDEAQSSLNHNLAKHLATLKEDFQSAARCYDAIYHQVIFEKKPVDRGEASHGFENNENTSGPKSIATGIVVGITDFNVNSPDEVFLAISGLSSEGQDYYVDDWCLEKKPQIPKNLLIELSTTLKSRKKDFQEREKLALKRQGLEDIESKSDFLSDEENNMANTSKISRSIRLKEQAKRHGSKSTNSLSSNSEDEYFSVKKGITNNKQQRGSVFESETSSGEDDNPNRIFELGINSSVNNSSLASLIALKSQMWGKTSEECYSDDG